MPGQGAGGDRRHRLHHVQFPRHSDRQGELADRRERHLSHRRYRRARHHGDSHSARAPLVVVGRQRQLGTSMTTPLNHSTASRDEGFTLIETVFALVILMIVAAGVVPLALVAVRATENQGHLAARTTEYAQDKLEQLMALSYEDVTSDTREFPAPAAGGSGLAIGGSSDPAAPAD